CEKCKGTILGNSISLLKEFDTYYRYSSNEKTNTMFESNEMIYRLGINFIGNNKVNWLSDFQDLIKGGIGSNIDKVNNRICILLALNDLYLKYPDKFIEKLETKCNMFKISLSNLNILLDKYKNDICVFKETYNIITLSKNIKSIRDNKKMNFHMNSGTLKVSTIQSFKGWECENLFLIIEKNHSLSFDELLYTGITRSRTNLIIINFGNEEYNTKLKELISKVK
ncbi:MAG: ATP-binding domain-containing protein, partial [Paludibacter sp.]